MGKVDYNTFIAMLSELNDFIYKWDRDYVLEVKAIGGFAIIVHRQMKHIDTPRTESRDIDSLTKDYPEPITMGEFLLKRRFYENKIVIENRRTQILRTF